MEPKKIALLIEDLYQDLEVWYPYYRLKEAGYEVIFVGPNETITKYKGKYGYPAQAEIFIEEALVQNYEAVIIPGGFAPDLMRKSRAMIDFVESMYQSDKVVAAICHGVWIPASANILHDKQATCYFAIADDIKNAGAKYVDEPVVVDGNLITSRQPDDLPDFCKAILKALQNAS